MRTKILFDDIDASLAATSDDTQFDRRFDFDLITTLDGTDGIPRIIIELAYTGGGCLPAPTDWYILPNCNGNEYFNIDDSPFTVHKSAVTANWIRVRIEPNTNTTGTATVILATKDYT